MWAVAKKPWRHGNRRGSYASWILSHSQKLVTTGFTALVKWVEAIMNQASFTWRQKGRLSSFQKASAQFFFEDNLPQNFTSLFFAEFGFQRKGSSQKKLRYFFYWSSNTFSRLDPSGCKKSLIISFSVGLQQTVSLNYINKLLSKCQAKLISSSKTNFTIER